MDHLEPPRSPVDEPRITVNIMSPSPEVPQPLTFDVVASSTVDELKSRIALALPSHSGPSQQRLIYRGKLLDGASTIGATLLSGNEEKQKSYTVHLVVTPTATPASPPRTEPAPSTPAAPTVDTTPAPNPTPQPPTLTPDPLPLPTFTPLTLPPATTLPPNRPLYLLQDSHGRPHSLLLGPPTLPPTLPPTFLPTLPPLPPHLPARRAPPRRRREIRIRAAHLWLALKLGTMVLLFSSGAGWWRTLYLSAIGLAIFVWQTGLAAQALRPLRGVYAPRRRGPREDVRGARGVWRGLERGVGLFLASLVGAGGDVGGDAGDGRNGDAAGGGDARGGDAVAGDELEERMPLLG